MNSKKSVTIYIIVIASILVLVNVLANRFFFRLDFTGDKRYTLSEATKNILNDLDDPVTVTAYFSEDLPPQIAQARSDFKDMLVEYANASDGNVMYEFVNPNKDDKTEQEAQQAGIRPVVINVREKDQAVQKKAYLGAVVKYGDKTEAIPFMQQGAAMEYDLSTAIKKLTVEDKPPIGFIQGDGEPAINAMQQAVQALDVLYKVDPVTITDTTNLLQYKTLCLIAPTDSIPQSHFQMLDKYLANGGNLYIAMNRVDGNLQQSRGYSINTGLETWLQKKGLNVENSFVIDAQCGKVSVRQQQGMFTFNTQMAFPYLPVASNFKKSPITQGLESVIFKFVSPIDYTGDSTLHYQPLVLSSKESGKQSLPLYFNIQKKWGKSDFTDPNETLAAMLSGKIDGSKNSRIILIGDGDFAINGAGQNAHQVQPDNMNLMVNSIDYLSDDTGLIALRTKGISSRPLKTIDDSTKTLLKYLNFLLPILLIVAFGIFRMQRNRMIRFKRMRDDFI